MQPCRSTVTSTRFAKSSSGCRHSATRRRPAQPSSSRCALESSLARRLQDILAEAALELNSQLEDGHVELRIAGHDLELVVVREDGSAPEAVDEAFSARITLRLPESLKVRIESSAAREGASVNTWLVQALQRAVESRHPSSSRGRNRLTGYGRS